ncbi:hypothetical protein [Actinomadura sp. 21ATH]|uniref:hypothetical protein n=1 Tax=Actinomadura sp. 21ATH TaxID=1735444 RepID=UPI0035BFDC7C
MSFRGIDHCLRCGRQLRASQETFIGDCCAQRITPERLEAMRAYAQTVADPFHIPAPRPMSVQGRINNANARAAGDANAVQLCRHESRIGACGQCRLEADPWRAAARILREIRAESYEARRAERIARVSARPIPSPGARPSRRRPAAPAPARLAPEPLQLELI